MKSRVALLTAVLLGWSAMAWADGELVYPWDNPAPSPAADCLDVPCVPCVFSLPGLSALRSEPKPCRVPGGDHAAPALAAADLSGEPLPPTRRR